MVTLIEVLTYTNDFKEEWKTNVGIWEMDHTKATSSKGKEVALSSAPSKRQRLAEQEEDSDYEMEDMAMYDEDEDLMVGEQPQWTENVPLTTFDPVWQPILYRKKMQGVTSIKKVLFNNNSLDNVYMKDIVEWMATLRRDEGNNPPKTTRLIGTVNGREMILSFETMNKVVKFDTKSQREYVYPERQQILGESTADAQWNDMVRVLFAKPPEAMGTKLLRSDLEVLPKLLSLISGFNVIPRLGDKLFIRNFEIRALRLRPYIHSKQ
ncbi:hypothetical protein R6Q59_006308 [Mikania micrantha]